MKFDDGQGGYHHIEIDNNVPADQIGGRPAASWRCTHSPVRPKTAT
jgi:hypothetical protein